jgi:endonuclease III
VLGAVLLSHMDMIRHCRQLCRAQRPR